jgi:LysR family transcriptional regulator, cyn operon transcriptional activator
MRIEWIRGFVAVAEQENYHKAARKLGIDEPLLSKWIKQLEDYLGDAKLFHRNRGGTRLSNAGAQLRDHAEKIVKELDDAERAMRPWRDAKGSVLRVGHTAGHREVVVETVIAVREKEEFASLRIIVEELAAFAIAARVLDGRLDLGLVHGWTERDGISHEPVGQSPLRLVVNPLHRLAGAKSIANLDEIAAEWFVLTESGRRSREIVEGYFQANHFVPKLAVETNAMTTALALVRSMRTVVTLLSVPAPHRDNVNGLPLVDLPATPPVQGSFLLWRGPAVRSEAARAFRVSLRQHLGIAKDGGAAPAGGKPR